MTTNDLVQLGQRFLFDASLLPDPPRQRFNVAPTQKVLVVGAGGGRPGRWPAFMVWGLVPPWAKQTKPGPINAVSETVASKPMFRHAIRKQRCLAIADGYYEWKAVPGSTRKVPFLFTLKNRQPFAFAGIWEHWSGEEGELNSCAILTTKPNPLAAEVHNRMPVIMRPDLEGRWLDPDMTDPAQLVEAFEPYPASEMEAYPVSTRVNSPRNDDMECVRPVA